MAVRVDGAASTSTVFGLICVVPVPGLSCGAVFSVNLSFPPTIETVMSAAVAPSISVSVTTPPETEMCAESSTPVIVIVTVSVSFNGVPSSSVAVTV